jgi:uncharacterized protein
LKKISGSITILKSVHKMKKPLQPIVDFLDGKEFAIAGVSRNKSKFGYLIFKDLKERGFTLYPVNPNTNKIDEITSYPNIQSLPEHVKKLYIVTKQGQTRQLVEEAVNKGIQQIWIQQMSDTSEAVKVAEENGLRLITGECMYMHAEPVKSIHKFHRGIRKFFGSFPV